MAFVAIKNKEMFLAMRDLFYGGEFSYWLSNQKIPYSAWKEYEDAMRFFEEETCFDCESGMIKAYKEDV